MVNPAVRLPTMGWSRVALAIGFMTLATAAFAQDKEAPKPKADDAPKPAPSPSVGRGTAQTQKINELLAKAWADNKIRPSARATDSEFLRRAYLDIIGRIATPAEVRHFELNRDRTKLIHRLLYEKVKIENHEYDYPEEFARNWANVWTVWLMTRSANPVYQEQMRVWLEELFAKNGSHKEMVAKLLTATGKTNDNGAVNYILRHMGEPNTAKPDEDGHFDAIPITSRTTRLFLGLQTQCVQCHDHPFNPDWKQSNFWSVNVFFKQVDREPRDLGRVRNTMDVVQQTLKDDPAVNKESITAYEKRSGVVLYTKAVFLDGRKADFDNQTKSRREVLADLVTSAEQFPKAYVNRIWGHLFGRGMNEQAAVDDFGEHNKVVHTELLDYLAKEFAAETPEYEFNKYNSFDAKKLLYWVCTSEAYGLSSVPNATNDKPEAEVFFSRMLLKAMSPEQLFDSLTLATEGVVQKQTEERKKRREEWMKKLVVNFGDDEGNEITFNGTLLQALMLMNGKELSEAIRAKDKGTLYEAMRKGKGTPNRVIEELYLATLNRRPGSEASRIGRLNRNDVNSYADLMWALLNSNEFILNH
jgi:Protein of unknown function (DUF1549)/Protein of unknown function (DUF1553)